MLFGGLEEIRTPDPHNANVVRSQLRYKPLFVRVIIFPVIRFVKRNVSPGNTVQLSFNGTQCL